MVQKTVLPNGIQVVTEEIPSVHSVSVGIWVEAGSRDERSEENGISHFIEHMLFKGTQRRSARQIAKEIDAVGGILNAFTSKEFSSFYAKVMAEHLPVALDLLFDLYLNSLFAAEELEKERQVIVQEINMVEDTPDEYIHDLFSQSFWPHHPLGLPILGRLNTISRMDRRTLKGFFLKHYLQIPPIIVAAGKLKHEDLLRPVQEALRKIRPRPKERKIHPPRPHPQIQVKNKQLEQVHLLLGTQGFSVVHPRRYAFTILNTILGGGMSSRLFQEVREKRGLAYSVYSFASSFVDSGLLGVYVGTGDHTLNRVLQVILREMKRLAENSIRPKELRSAKEQLKGNLLLSLESTDSRMSRLAKNEIFFHRFVSTEEIIEGIEKVSAEEIGSLAQEIFRPDSFSLTVLGPVTEKTIPKTLLAA
ncbi:MAG: pitrilysin family protein [Deltaproteobacteria bacterium]|jgi:predicted Zn-dependent peptidase|nr:pitrilysin family protein [Deltaproteobacteria bacterium]